LADARGLGADVAEATKRAGLIITRPDAAFRVRARKRKPFAKITKPLIDQALILRDNLSIKPTEANRYLRSVNDDALNRVFEDYLCGESVE